MGLRVYTVKNFLYRFEFLNDLQRKKIREFSYGQFKI